MEHFISSLGAWGDWLYALIFAGMLIEGNTTMFIVGFLLSSSTVLSPLGLLLSAFLGTWAEQLFWFWFGSRLKASPSRFASWLIAKTDHFDEHFIHRPKTTLFLSKFIYGIHRAAIARTAVLGLTLKTYLKHIIPVLLLWMLIIGGVGYLVKRSFNLFDNYLRFAELFLLGILIVMILIQRFVLSGRLKKFWDRI